MNLVPGQHIHLVGIGGFGLSAIARVLLQQGFFVSGSDRKPNALTDKLKREGATIYRGHDPVYVVGAELVIVSSAIPRDNIEVMAAEAQGIPVYKRADVIAAIMSGHIGIAIAGAHGKTTTTAMTTHVLMETGQRPSYIIGGILRNTGNNADIDDGRVFVIEADEYDNMFHGLRPQIEVITNIEWDHPDFFRTPHEMVESFSHFVGLLPNDGLLVVCADDHTALIFGENRVVVGLPTATYGIDHPQAMWRAAGLRLSKNRLPVFEAIREGETLGKVELRVPGRHNVLNALAALIVADSQGVPFEDAAHAIATFDGTGRRFDLRGDIEGVAVIDDYAHHPTEIHTTLAAAREKYPERDIWAVWQPHTFTRTQKLLEGFLNAFEAADHVLVTDIFVSRERPIPGVNSAAVVAAMRHPDARYLSDLDDAVDLLDAEVRSPAVVLVMSAGDATRISEAFLARRQARFAGSV